ncbi:MAG: hypothetical protein HKN26_05810 [Acidimicrobiales bacterium]|nr:hypothetical protein [Acidimicrobiales bacterium]
MAIDDLRARYAELFPGPIGLAADGIAPPDAEVPALLLCFTNRSGSNYLAELLRSTGQLGWAPEAFLAEFITAQRERWPFEVETLAEYCRALRHNLTAEETRPPFVKIGWQQLFLLGELGILDDVFPNRRILLVRRRDLLAQAASYAIAASSGQWRSDHESSADDTDDAAATDITTDNVRARTRSVQLADRHVRNFAAVTGDPLLEVAYEDFEAEPQWVVDEVLTFAGLSPTPIAPDAVAVARQRSERNRQLADAVRAEVQQHWTAGPPQLPERTGWGSFAVPYPVDDLLERVRSLWPDPLAAASSPAEPDSLGERLVLIVSPLITDGYDVGNWLTSHPDIAGPPSPLFPTEPADAHPDGLVAHLTADLAAEAPARYRVKVVRPYELCFLVESRLIPTVLGKPRVLVVRHHDIAAAGRALLGADDADADVVSALYGLRAISAREQLVREITTVFGLDTEDVVVGATIEQVARRRVAIAEWLGCEPDLLFAPTALVRPPTTRQPRRAEEAVIDVWPRVIDHESGEISTYGA